MDVVRPLVAQVQGDEDLVRVLGIGGDDLGLGVLERREVALGSAAQVHLEEPPVLVAVLVLEVAEAAAVLGPEVGAHAAAAVLGDGPAGTRRAGLGERRHPDVQDALVRGEIGDAPAVGRDGAHRLLGVPEQDLAWDEGRRGHLPRSSVTRKADSSAVTVATAESSSSQRVCVTGAPSAQVFRRCA